MHQTCYNSKIINDSDLQKNMGTSTQNNMGASTQNNIIASNISNNIYSNNFNKSDNTREHSNQRMQNFDPIPTMSGIPFAKKSPSDNRLNYPVLTRNLKYKPINSELDKQNSERSSF